jgi:hypothetical protein
MPGRLVAGRNMSSRQGLSLSPRLRSTVALSVIKRNQRRMPDFKLSLMGRHPPSRSAAKMRHCHARA